jgi:hypothetical protein
MAMQPATTSSSAAVRTRPTISDTSNLSSASDRERVVSRVNRIRNQVRIAITGFVLVLFGVVTLGWIWTTAHQPPPLRTASHLVLGLAALAGIFALAKIWRRP